MTTTRPRQRYRERKFAWQSPDSPTTAPSAPAAPTAAVLPIGPVAPPEVRRRPTVLAGALTLIATLGAAGWGVGHHDPLAGTTVAPGPTTLTTAYNSACGLAGGNAATPAAAPTITWQNFGIASLPISTVYGPGRRSDAATWSCFARTPTGAVLAAWTIPFRTAVAKDFSAVVRGQTLPGPGQNALLKQGQVAHSLTDRVEPLGFRILSYSPDLATVSFHVTQYGQDFRCAAQVQWTGGATGDWLLRLQPDGNTLSTCQRLKPAEAGQFVRWGPASAGTATGVAMRRGSGR
jgi:hypothetical protein